MRILGTHHLALTTTRFAQLRQFYVDTLRLPVVGGFPGHEIVFVEAGDTIVELIGEDASDRATPVAPGCPPAGDRARRAGWHHLAWEVDDVDTAFAELLDLGVTPHSPPESFPPDRPTMRIAFVADPDGNLIELVQPLGARYPSTD